MIAQNPAIKLTQARTKTKYLVDNALLHKSSQTLQDIPKKTPPQDQALTLGGMVVISLGSILVIHKNVNITTAIHV